MFPVIAALAARLNIRHQIKTILSLAFLGVLLDIDHLFIGLERMLLHNVFITLLIPLILLALAFLIKLDKYKKGFILLLLIFLSSHVFLDLFNPNIEDGIRINMDTGGVALFYPLSTVKYSIDFNLRSTDIFPFLPQASDGYLVSSLGFGILMYFIIVIVPCLFLDDIIELAEKRHEKFMKASKEFFRNILKD